MLENLSIWFQKQLYLKLKTIVFELDINIE